MKSGNNLKCKTSNDKIEVREFCNHLHTRLGASLVKCTSIYALRIPLCTDDKCYYDHTNCNLRSYNRIVYKRCMTKRIKSQNDNTNIRSDGQSDNIHSSKLNTYNICLKYSSKHNRQRNVCNYKEMSSLFFKGYNNLLETSFIRCKFLH